MNYVYSDIPRIYTALAEWLSCVVYLYTVERTRTRGKFYVVSCMILGVQILFLVLTDDVPTAFWLLCMLVAAGLMYAYLVWAGNLNWIQTGYCCARAFLLAEFAASLEWQLYSFLERMGFGALWLQLLMLVVVYALVFYIAYRLEKSIMTSAFLKQISWHELVVVLGITIVTFAFSNLSFVLSNTPFSSTIQTDAFHIRTLVDAVGLATQYAFQSRIGEYIAEMEVMSVKSALKNQYDQYRNYQNSMELVHIKYHDLKHQIVGLRGEQDAKKRAAWLDAMEKELWDNQLVESTGNQVLDTILGAKILQARKNKVQITCVADGTLLDFMHVTDICAIFGNALDNALESVVFLQDPQKRLIHLKIYAKKNFVLIEISNYCEQELKREKGGLLLTTKADTHNHGYGLKSIQYSVEKYGGSVSVDKKENWFELHILIPKPYKP